MPVDTERVPDSACVQSQELGHAAQSSSDYSFNNEQKKQVLGLNLLRGWGLGVRV